MNDELNTHFYADTFGTPSLPREEEFEGQIEYEPPAKVREERDSLRKELVALRSRAKQLSEENQRLKTLPPGQADANERMRQQEWEFYKLTKQQMTVKDSIMYSINGSGIVTGNSSQTAGSFLQKLNNYPPGAVKKKHGL